MQGSAKATVIRKLIQDVGESIGRSAKSANKVSKSLTSYERKAAFYENYSRNQLDKAIGITGFATGLGFATTDFIDRFGDEMSTFGKFAVGFGSTAISTTMGISAATAYGRSAIARFGGGSRLREIKDDLRGKRISKHRARIERTQKQVYPTQEVSPIYYDNQGKIDLARVTDPASPSTVKLTPAPPRGNAMDQHDKELRGISLRLKKVERGKKKLFEKKAPGAKRSNIDKVKNVLAVENAQKFSTLGALKKGVGGFFGGVLGPLTGRGTLYGAADPTMKFIGSSIPLGIGIGGGAGVGLGIYSASTRNLGPTKGPKSRQQRSFSNLTHNATLHSHRMNSNALR